MALAAGTRLGPYEIQTAIGEAGCARDSRLDRRRAIKVQAPHIAVDPAARARFEREARVVAALDPPHICGIYDVGGTSAIHYLAMPILGGQALAARLAKGPVALDQALAIATEVADALDGARRQGIVHRDLKPANIMRTKSGPKRTSAWRSCGHQRPRYRCRGSRGSRPRRWRRRRGYPGDGVVHGAGAHDNAGNFSVYVREASAGEGQPLFTDSSYDVGCKISPGGRWLAYHSNETGVLNVFLRSFRMAARTSRSRPPRSPSAPTLAAAPR